MNEKAKAVAVVAVVAVGVGPYALSSKVRDIVVAVAEIM